MRRKFSTVESELLWDLYKEKGSRPAAVREALGLPMFQGRDERTLQRKIDAMRKDTKKGLRSGQSWRQEEIDELMDIYSEVGNQARAARIFCEKNPSRSFSAAQVRLCVECKKEEARTPETQPWRVLDVGLHNMQIGDKIFKEMDEIEEKKKSKAENGDARDSREEAQRRHIMDETPGLHGLQRVDQEGL